MASDDAIPVEKGDVGGLLVQRLQAWKHAVGYLEAYVSSIERVHKEFSKEYEKVLKVSYLKYSKRGSTKICHADGFRTTEGGESFRQLHPSRCLY